jgi:ATP-dependent RNA helicase RhlE
MNETIPKTFDTLGLADALLRAVHDQGYETPTPIQARAIPPALEGRDVLGCAQTGTGKTAAFVLPILQRLAAAGKPPAGKRPIRALVLTPTRELAAQISESASTYGAHLPLTHTVVYGGVSQGRQERAIRNGIDVLVACPGRLLDLMNQRIVDLRGVEFFVLDEADRMLDMGFIHDVRRIIAKLPQKRQTLFFSATVPPVIRKLADDLLVNPVTVQVAAASCTAEKVKQVVYRVGRKSKLSLLRDLIEDPAMQRTLVFTRTKHGADRVMKRLIKDKVPAEAIHGNKSQNARIRALEAFKGGKVRVLVATDIAARGIDVDSITHVINYELPNEPETYVHRIGRTGRAGNSGHAISFCDSEEADHLRSIQKLIKQTIPEVKEHAYAGTHIGEEPRPTRQQRPPRQRQASGPGQRRGPRGQSGSGRTHSGGNTRRRAR